MCVVRVGLFQFSASFGIFADFLYACVGTKIVISRSGALALDKGKKNRAAGHRVKISECMIQYNSYT